MSAHKRVDQLNPTVTSLLRRHNTVRPYWGSGCATEMNQYYYRQYARRNAPAGGAAAARVGGPLADAYATLWLRPGAPAAVIRAAYRALAALHHPDIGGDPAVMRRLNDAYACLRRDDAAA